MGVEPLLGKSYGEKNADKIKWYFKAGIIFNEASVLLISELYKFWIIVYACKR